MTNYLRNSRNLFFLSVSFFLLAILIHWFFNKEDSLNRIGQRIESRLSAKEEMIRQLLADPLVDTAVAYASSPQKNTPVWKELNDKFSENNVILLLFNGDRLAFWTSNRVVPEKQWKLIKEGTNFLKLDNGWYFIIKETRGTVSLVTLLSIRKEYNYQNEYLRNRFADQLGFPDYIELSNHVNEGDYAVKDSEGKVLFMIAVNSQKFSLTPVYYEVGLWILAILFLYLSVNSFAKFLWNKGEWLAALLSIGIVIILFRSVTMIWSVPRALYKLDIFSPEHYASNFLFPSMGDLLLNLLLLHWLVSFFYERGRELNFRIQKVKISYLVSFLFIAATFVFIDLLNYMFEGLVMNSNISFELTNILSLSSYSLIGFFLLGLTLYTFFLFTDILISIFHQFYLSKQEKLLVFIGSVLLILAAKAMLNELNILMITNTVFLVVLERAKTRKKEYLTFPTVVMVLMIFALASASRLTTYTANKEKENRKLMASKLESANDPIAEYLLEELVKKLKSDPAVKDHFSSRSPNNEKLYARVQQLYFGGYFSKYDLSIYEFDNNGAPFNTNVTRDLEYFNELIEQQCTPTFNRYFYYLSNSYGILTYYGKIPMFEGEQRIGTLVIELKSKYFRDDNIFPELLLEGSLKMNKDFQAYSYSIYKQGRLVTQQGNYPYSLQSAEFSDASQGYTFLKNKGYDHLVYKPNPQLLIVVSREEESSFKVLAVFSYIFGIFSLLLFIFYIRRTVSRNYNPGNRNLRSAKGKFRFLFKTRIQTSMVFSVIVSVSLIGYITLLYISEQYNKQQYERISQKVRSILLALEKRTSNLRSISLKNDDNFSIELKNLSDLYLTDINIFDQNGNLVISSQPKIYEEGLVSRKMNPEAYIELRHFARSEFTTNERIGTLNYLSSYAPIRNISNKTIAYLNLPYFANKTEYELRVSQFLTTFINVYVFIFVMIGFVAFFLANSITLPLTLIEQQLRETKIGKKMDPISWKRRDEIGTLINEYNRMIGELEESTEKLAKSERENAWREMAKQVAHEIKNPLTPIKLGMQQLERSWRDGDPQFDEKFEKFSRTIIQQIESLALIASEFSNFAQMPVARTEKVDVKEILKSVVDLYKNSAGATISLGFLPALRAHVLADKDQMIRTFNNLIKNAIQAIPAERNGEVNIEMLNDGDTLLIMIQDNGIGIEESLREKIFTPNFTTKNSGMGMGLAIIRNIILNAGGKVWFESVLNKGTAFYVSLPLYVGDE